MDVQGSITTLQQELDKMIMSIDLPGSWSGRQINAYEERRGALRARIGTLRNESEALKKLEPQLEALCKWRDNLVAWQSALLKEIEGHMAPRTPQEQGVRQNLLLGLVLIEGRNDPPEQYGYSLETLRLGALMRASGFKEDPQREGAPKLPWFGSLTVTEAQIADVTAKVDTAKLRIEDALMSDDQREQKAKDDLLRQRTENAKPQRKTRGDGSVFLKYPDGHTEEVSSAGTSARAASSRVSATGTGTAT